MVMNAPVGPSENKEHSSYFLITVRRKQAVKWSPSLPSFILKLCSSLHSVQYWLSLVGSSLFSYLNETDHFWKTGYHVIEGNIMQMQKGGELRLPSFIYQQIGIQVFYINIFFWLVCNQDGWCSIWTRMLTNQKYASMMLIMFFVNTSVQMHY